MAWSYGFYNSLNGDRVYNADQMSAIFDGLITNGVYESIGKKLAVEPNSGMTIQINTGRGWFGSRWVNNDSEYLQTLEESDVLLNRYCAVCVRADNTQSVRAAEPYFKYSEFATNPVKPTMERSETVKEYCLAYVYIKAGATSITAADIEDTRGNTELCGWVTGLIEQVDTNTLWKQWEAQWQQFIESYEGDATGWMEQQQEAFKVWADNLESYLDENAEAKIASDILQLQQDIEPLKERCVKSSGTLDGLGWVSQDDGTYTQTITVEGVTADNDIMISPTAEHEESYTLMDCEAVSQAVDSITFECTNPQDVDVELSVIIYNF